MPTCAQSCGPNHPLLLIWFFRGDGDAAIHQELELGAVKTAQLVGEDKVVQRDEGELNTVSITSGGEKLP